MTLHTLRKIRLFLYMFDYMMAQQISNMLSNDLKIKSQY